MPTEEHGWTSESGMLEPLWSDGQILPSSLIELLDKKAPDATEEVEEVGEEEVEEEKDEEEKEVEETEDDIVTLDDSDDWASSSDSETDM